MSAQTTTTTGATPQHRPSISSTTTAAPAPATAQDAASTAAKDWKEEDYILALAHLEQTQDLLSSLRLTIPQLVRSLTRRHATPQELWADFRRETLGGGKKVAELRKLWEGSDMREIRAKVELGVKERGEGFGALGVADDVKALVGEEITEMGRFGWREEGEQVRVRKRKRDEEEAGVAVGPGEKLDGEQVEKVVEEFGKKYEGVTASFDKESRRITVGYEAGDGTALRFDISAATVDDKAVYEISGPQIPDNATKGERKLLLAVHRCLLGRPKQSNLEYTLDILAAYKDLREAKCDVCQRILDEEGSFTAIRKDKRIKGENGEEVKWIALHEGCADEDK